MTFEWTAPFVREMTKKEVSENQPHPCLPARAGKNSQDAPPKSFLRLRRSATRARRCLGAVRLGTARGAVLWVPSSLVMMLRTTDCGEAAILRRATPGRRIRMKMKTLLVTGVLLLALFISGCNVNPAPAATVGPAGPPGAAGATGQTGDPGRDADQRRAEDQKRADEQRRTDEQRGADQQRGADDQKRADEQKRADAKAREGRDEQCPAGEHRFTSRETGKVSCVTD